MQISNMGVICPCGCKKIVSREQIDDGLICANSSCKRELFKRCKREGANPNQIFAMLEQVACFGNYKAIRVNGRIMVVRTKNDNNLISVNIPKFLSEYLEAFAI